MAEGRQVRRTHMRLDGTARAEEPAFELVFSHRQARDYDDVLDTGHGEASRLAQRRHVDRDDTPTGDDEVLSVDGVGDAAARAMRGITVAGKECETDGDLVGAPASQPERVELGAEHVERNLGQHARPIAGSSVCADRAPMGEAPQRRERQR